MPTIKLVSDGVFPILRNGSGTHFPVVPQTGLAIPGTIQGEGKLAGIPVLFIRTAGCNLRCSWTLPDGTSSICDTPLSSFDTRDSVEVEVKALVETILLNRGNIEHLVISGGEPMVQPAALGMLLKSLKEAYPFHIQIETNGTIFKEELAEYIDFFSISPKLSSSTPRTKAGPFKLSANARLLHEARRKRIDVLQAFIDHARRYSHKDFQLKWVYSKLSDIDEIKAINQELEHVAPSDNLLMPLGANAGEVALTEQECLVACIQQGWRFSPRYHISLFGDKHGV